MMLVCNMGWRTAAVQHDELDRGTAGEQEQGAAGHRTVPAAEPGSGSGELLDACMILSIASTRSSLPRASNGL